MARPAHFHHGANQVFVSIGPVATRVEPDLRHHSIKWMNMCMGTKIDSGHLNSKNHATFDGCLFLGARRGSGISAKVKVRASRVGPPHPCTFITAIFIAMVIITINTYRQRHNHEQWLVLLTMIAISILFSFASYVVCVCQGLRLQCHFSREALAFEHRRTLLQQ